VVSQGETSPKLCFVMKSLIVCPGILCDNLKIWGGENPCAVIKHMRDSSKLNVFCAVS
jgi:hypothetical protein